MYWIPYARKKTKKVRRNCIPCKKFMAKCFIQKEAPLPSYRVNIVQAFHALGLDHAGITITIPGLDSAASVLIISCAVTRAVVLEPVPDQTHESTVTAFNKFCHTRGVCPSIVISDNAKGFLKAKTILMRQRPGLEWTTNASRASWWGGFFESHVKLMKNALASEIPGLRFRNWHHFEESIAFMEFLVNNRPLTSVSDDRGNEFSITPNQFLNPQSKENFSFKLEDLLVPPEMFYADSADRIVRRYFEQQRFYERLYHRLQRDYVDSLRKFHHTKFFSKPDDIRLKVGDMVLLKPSGDFKAGSKLKRILWNKGKIVEILTTRRDNCIRAVRLEFRKDDGTTVTLGPYPIQLIAPLETAEAPDREKEVFSALMTSRRFHIPSIGQQMQYHIATLQPHPCHVLPNMGHQLYRYGIGYEPPEEKMDESWDSWNEQTNLFVKHSWVFLIKGNKSIALG